MTNILEEANKYFVGLLYDDTSKKKIQRLMKSIRLENPTNINRLHTTIFNDKITKNKDKESEIWKHNHPLKWETVGKKYSIHDYKGKKVLLLDVECRKCKQLQKYIQRKYKGYKYPQYNPHITISYDYKQKDVPKGGINPKGMKLQTKQLIVSKN